MRKFALTLAFCLTSLLASFAADLSTVWQSLQDVEGFYVVPLSAAEAAESGFEKLTVALNSSPTAANINKANQLAATIDPSQKITSVSQDGVNVAVYIAPENVDATEYKLLLLITKNDNADKVLMALYGICTREGLNVALQNLSIEKLIGS